MGEMTEYVLDSIEMFEGYRENFEALAVGCRYCGEGNLWWRPFETKNGRDYWWLVDTKGKPHNCPKRR